jgi:hypothetical protein
MGSSYESAAKLLRTGPSRPTLYEVEIDFTSVLGTTNYRRATDHLRLFCRTVQVPGISMDVVDPTGYTYGGITQSVPVGISWGQNGPLKLQQIESSDWTVYRALRALLERHIANSNGYSGANPIQGSQTIRMNYYDEQTFAIGIYKLEFADDGYDEVSLRTEAITDRSLDIQNQRYRAGYKKVCKFTFNNAYLTYITDLGLASESTDQPLNYGCGFNYETYSVEWLPYE